MACSLVNLTTWRQAKPAFLSIREAWPTPGRLACADQGLEALLTPLGLWRRRGTSLRRLAFAWVLWGPPTCAAGVKKYPGLGQYASDSWAIFLDGRTDVQPNDGKLNWYMEGLRAREDADGRGAVQPGGHRPRDPGQSCTTE